MTHPTDALRLVPCPFCGGEAERFEMADRAGVRCADVMCAGSHRLPSHGEDYVAAWNRRAAPASPLPEGGGQCSGISGELDPRLVEWGYTSLDEAITHLGKLLDDQTAFDGLGTPTGAK